MSQKTLASYEQTLRLFIKYLQDECSITKTEQVKEQTVLDYVKSIKERGKYTVVANDNTKRLNNPQNRRDFGRKVSIATINNYIRNLTLYFNYMYDKTNKSATKSKRIYQRQRFQ